MKFLFTAKRVQHGLPPEQVLPMVKAMKEWHEENIKNGTIDIIYNFVQGGGFGIHNFDSAEDAFVFLTEYPGYPLYDWEVIPLVDNKKIMDKAISRYEKAIELQKQADS
jgi:hypothetical protein